MEFFHAEILWSGYGRVITNTPEIPNGDTGILNGTQEDVLVEIFLKDTEVNALMDYLQRKFDRKLDKGDFENYMEREFYIGTPIDSWFDMRKFTRVCAQLEIQPKTYSYLFELL